MHHAGIAETLGIEAENHNPMSPLALATAVNEGLPVSALDRVARDVAPGDAAFRYRLVPRATLARRRSAAARLSPDEGAKVARLAGVWAFTREVWGSDADARGFLFRPHMLLEDRRPVDVVLDSEFGGRLVEGILGGLKYGTAI